MAEQVKIQKYQRPLIVEISEMKQSADQVSFIVMPSIFSPRKSFPHWMSWGYRTSLVDGSSTWNNSTTEEIEI